MRRQLLERFASAALLIVCTASFANASSGEYRIADVAALKITFDSEWAQFTTPGYVPIRFDITNLGEAREIELLGQGMRFLRLAHRFTQVSFDVRRTVRLARGDRVRLTIPIPVYADNENFMFEVREGDRSLERFNYTGFTSGNRPEHASVLIVANSATPFGKSAPGWPRPMSSIVGSGAVLSGRVVFGPSGPPSPTRPVDFVLPPSRLPDNWLGFTSLRAVAIGPTEWEQLDATQKNALLTWTACGGDLFFVDGQADALFPGRPLSSPEQPVRAYFFGRVHTPTSQSVTAAWLDVMLSKATALQDANFALPANRAVDWALTATRGFRLPIPGVEGIPARSYFMILVVFSILIGPINYWLLWRSRQQVFVVLTTPLIAAIFIVLLAGYVLAGEGVGVRGRAATFTMLDQHSKQAATRGGMSLYAAGMAPSGGLRFGRDEAVYARGTDGTGSHEATSIDLTESQRLASGFIYARSPTNLETIGFRAARERLGFERESGVLDVTNGFGVPIRSLVHRSGTTVYTISAPLLPGHKGRLTPGAPSAADIVPGGFPLSSRYEHLLANLPDNTYLAILDRSPFWHPGVANVDERDSLHVVFGWVGGQP